MRKALKKGLFITLEGGEGAGKTSVIRLIQNNLESQNIPYMVTREPGGITISEEIRAVILNVLNTSMDARTEALLYAAARRQHLVEKVIPALESGITVICDRFIDSSLAYQGHARGLGMDEIFRVNEFAIDAWMPDLTLWLDIDPVIGMDRIHRGRNQEINRLDLESMQFHEKVREGYRVLHERYPQRIKRINANQSLEEVHNDVQNIIFQHKERTSIRNKKYEETEYPLNLIFTPYVDPWSLIHPEWLKAYLEEQKALYDSTPSAREAFRVWNENREYFYSLQSKFPVKGA